MARSPRRETKRLSAAMQPVSFCTSFSLVDEFILKTSLSFFGLTSMTRYDTINPRFDDDVVTVCFHVAPELIVQAPLHGSLIGCACILQAERHRDVAVGSERRDERCLDAIRLGQADLVVS